MRQLTVLIQGVAAPLEGNPLVGAQSSMVRQDHITGFKVEKVKGTTRIGLIAFKLTLKRRWQILTPLTEGIRPLHGSPLRVSPLFPELIFFEFKQRGFASTDKFRNWIRKVSRSDLSHPMQIQNMRLNRCHIAPALGKTVRRLIFARPEAVFAFAAGVVNFTDRLLKSRDSTLRTDQCGQHTSASHHTMHEESGFLCHIP